MGGSLNEAAASGPSDFGRRMLAKFGWRDGDGLGKHGTGMQEHIRVKRREDGLGLGASVSKPTDNMWAPPPTARDSDSDSDDDDDSDDEAATGGAGGAWARGGHGT